MHTQREAWGARGSHTPTTRWGSTPYRLGFGQSVLSLVRSLECVQLLELLLQRPGQLANGCSGRVTVGADGLGSVGKLDAQRIVGLFLCQLGLQRVPA